MYGYFEPRTAEPRSLVVNVSDFGTKRTRVNSRLGTFYTLFSFSFLFEPYNAEVLHASNM